METVIYNRGYAGITLTQSQLDELRSIFDLQRSLFGMEGAVSNSDEGLGVPIYAKLLEFISDWGVTGFTPSLVPPFIPMPNFGYTPKVGVDPTVWRWIEGATRVNSGDGFFADFIREYTKIQFELRGGSANAAENYNQEASNRIAFGLAQDILDNFGALPGLLGLGAIDAGAAASTVFGKLPGGNDDYAPWAGSLLFPYLGSDNFFRDLLLNSERVTANIQGIGSIIIKYNEGTYDLIAMLQAAQKAGLSSGLENWREGIRNLIYPDVIDRSQDDLISLTNKFFADYYDITQGIFAPGNDLVFNRFQAAINNLLPETKYQIGKYGDDTLVAEDAEKVVVMNGGTGNDNLTGGKKGDLIDGDDGKDTIHGGEGDDYLFGGKKDDELHGDAGNDHLDGGAGDDELNGGDGYDILLGGAGNDILDGGAGNDILKGGSDNDTYNFSGHFGRDTVIDSDASGAININGSVVSELKLLNGTDEIYTSNNTDAVTFSDGTSNNLLVFTRPSGEVKSNSVLIKNWSEGDLGIQILEPEEPIVDESTTGTFNGDSTVNVIDIWDFRLTLLGSSVDASPYINLIADGGGGADFLTGAFNGSDILRGGADNDFILGGNQLIGVENDNALYMVEHLDIQGSDQLYGDAGSDYIVVSGKNSVARGGTENDFIRADQYIWAEFRPFEADGGVSAGDDYDVSENQVWEDFSKFLQPHYIHNQTENFIEFTEFNTDITSPDWSAQQTSASGLTYFYVQRPETTNSNTLLATTHYGEVAPSFDVSAGGRVTINGSFQVKWLSGSYSDNANLQIADYQDMKGHNLYGDEGDDVVFGGVMSDYISGGQGKDTLLGLDGHDIIDGGTEEDEIRGGTGDDILIGGAGDDVIYGNGIALSSAQTSLPDDDVIYGGEGKDDLDGGAGNDYLDGGGGVGEDSLRGGKGNDYLYGGDDEVKDILSGGEDDDTIVIGKFDHVSGDEGDDIYIWSPYQVNANSFQAEAVNIEAEGATSSSTFADLAVVGANSSPTENTYIIDSEGNNTLALVGEQDFTSFSVDKSATHLFLSTGNKQQIILQDALVNASINIVTGSSIEALATGNMQVKTITDDTFLSGNSLLAGQQISTTALVLSNLQRAVNVAAAASNTYLAGGLVDDTLTGHINGSRFIGGKGNDTFFGGIGDDTYLIRKGDGQDIITEMGGNNTLKLDKNITVNQLQVSRVGTDLLIKISDEQTILVNNMFDAATGALIIENAVQAINFYDGTVWDIESIKQRALTGSVGNDVIGGFETNDIVVGGKGNDQLNDQAGDDVYQYALGDGNDVIADAGGNDRIELSGGILPDQVIAFRDVYNNLVLKFSNGEKITVAGAFDASGNFTAQAIETLQFSDASTWDAVRILQEVAAYTPQNSNGTDGDDALLGDAASDILVGGKGNDRILGDAGDDTYRYTLGDGNDVIVDVAGLDRIELGGIAQDQLIARSNGRDLALSFTDGGSLTVKDMFVSKSQTPVDPLITQIIEELQTNWIAQAEVLIEEHYGLVGNGEITLNFERNGTSGVNRAHVEVVQAGEGNNPTQLILSINLDAFAVMPNGAGPWYHDRNIAHEMVHAVMASNMSLSGMPGWFLEGTAELIQGADERVWNEMGVIGNANNFNLLFKTTAGSPTTNAGYAVSYIAVKLLDQEIRDNGGGGIKELFDVLQTGKTLDQALAAVSLAHNGMNSQWNNLASFESHFKTVGFTSMDTLLNIKNADTGSIAGSDYGFSALDANSVLSNIHIGPSQNFTIVIPDEYINSVGVHNEMESIQFSDGSVWNAERIQQEMMSASIIGTDSNDDLIGTDGNEILIGHENNDNLDGGNGNDIYQFEMGDGWDYITEIAGTDTIRLGASINESDVSVHRYFNQLRVLLSNGQYITVKKMFDMDTGGIISENAIEKIQFSNGNSWDINRIRQEITKGVVLQGTAGSDNFDGFFANDILNGNGGGDYLWAYDGDDILNGGTGDDALIGGLGNDLYQFSLGDGSDGINEEGGVDTIKFASGILESNVVLSRSQANLIIGLSTGEKITVWGMFDAATGAIIPNAAIEKIQFSNNTVWDLNYIQQAIVMPLILQGKDGDDNLVGSGLNDTLIGGKGNDSLNGLNGDDTYQINLGDGVDTIVDNGGADSIKFGAGIFEGNVIVSRNGLVITPNTGEQRVYFNYTAIEKVEFADGNIWDAAYIQKEAIKGTTGNDEISGFNTNEVFTGGKGNDTIYGSGGDDTYIFNRGDGIDRIRTTGDTIRFGLGINESDVTVRYDSWGIASFYLNTGERIDFGLSSHPEGAQVGGVQFTGGASWDAARIYKESIKGSSGADNIYSFSGNDTISGGAGADSIVSGAGNDVINGGFGFDSLDGRAGDDTYQFARGDGVDVIKDSGGADTIQFLSGILPGDVTLIKVGDDLFISIADSNNSIKVTNEFLNGVLNPSSALEKITFLDGTIWGSTMIEQKIVESTQNPALIVGENYWDEIHLAGTANYVIYGMDGNDDISGGDGNDKLIGGNGINILDGGKGNNTYFINDDAGTQIVTSFANVSGQTNRVLFSDAVSKDDVKVRLAPRHRVSDIENSTTYYHLYESSIMNIVLTSNKQSVYLVGDFRYQPYAAQDFGFVEFSDGTKWDINELLRRSSTDVPMQPTAQFDTTGQYITGVAEGGTRVSVKNANGVELGSDLADASDGRFYITLATALINSETVNLTAKNTEGNISVAKSITAPLIDVTPPAQPTAAFDSTGKIISGISEAGSIVSVKIASGVEIGSVRADATSGVYKITLLTALTQQDIVNVTAKDSAGNTSIQKSITAPNLGTDITPPAQPTAAFDTAGKVISGVAEAGSTVSVKNASAVEVESIVANATTGAYSITLATAFINSETVNVTAKDVAGNISVVKTITAPDLTAPSIPSAAFDAPGKVITGNAEAGSMVEVKNASGTLLGSVIADNAGVYSLALATALINQETVNVTAKDATGNISAIKSIIAPDKTAPAVPTAAIDATRKIITGVAEAGSTVEVKNTSGTVLGSIAANTTTGAYSITVGTALTINQTVNITAKDLAGNVSSIKAVIAVGSTDTTSPATPTASFDAAGLVITGVAEAGSTVSVKNTAGSELKTATANATTGAYSITLTAALINQETVNVTATDAAGNISAIKSIVAPDKTAPSTPTASFDTAGLIITGVAEVGSTVSVKNAAGTELKTATANVTTGAYSIILTTALINKETVNVTAKDGAGNISPIKSIVAPDKTAPSAPTASFDPAGLVISGEAEASSMVSVKNAAGTELKTVTANASTGAYSITLTTALINKETVNVTAKDAAGNISPIKAIVAPDKTAPSAPTASFDTAGLVITGVSEAGSVVVVKNANNTSTLGTVTAHATTGAYSITLPSALIYKETVNITATDAAGNVSVARAVVAPDVAVPNPSPLVIQAENYTSMSGVQKETASDVGGGQNAGYIDAGDWMAYNNAAFNVPAEGRYRVTYRVASLNGGGRLTLKELSNDNALGSITVPKTAGWQNWVDVTQEITLSGGVHNFKLAADIGGFNVNWFKLEPLAPVAPDITPPVQPTAAFDTEGKIITGIAEAGSSVVVKNANNTSTLGTVTAHATTGAYSITLTGALINKESVNVTATDAVGNISAIKAIIAPDKTAPALPAANFDTAGKVISGTAEAGSVVVVKNANNTSTLGTVTAHATTGAYSITLVTALINKETVNITATDVAGNVSVARAVVAPDTAVPNPSALVIQAENYTSMSGVQKESASDVGGGQNVGYIEAGDWMAYNNAAFKVPTGGRYRVTYRVASLNGGGRLTLKELSTDAALSSISVPKTSGWQNWADVTQEITLSGGEHNFKLAADIGGFNINWFKLESLESTASVTAPLTKSIAMIDSQENVMAGIAEAGGVAVVNDANNTSTLGTVTADATRGVYEPVVIVAEISRLKTDYESLHYVSSNDVLIQAMASFVSGAGVDTRYRSTHVEQSPLMIAVAS